MPKYDMYCANCDLVYEIEHPYSVDHPKTHPECGGPVTVYISPGSRMAVHFISSRGGGADDWASKVAPAPQPMTSDDADVPYD